jgi:thiol-disulfide isomerase/thioredoxin
MRLAIVLAAVGLAASPAPAGPLTFAEAQQAAAREGKPLLVDFYASWCRPCKAFAQAADSDEDVREALADVVLCKLDAEKEGLDLAKAQRVEGYPTFLLMNAEGDTYDRWAGYAEDFFLERMAAGLGDLTTIDAKRRRFEASPGATDAMTLARYHATRGEYPDAVGLLDRAAALDPARDVRFDRFECVAAGFLNRDLFAAEEVTRAADAVVASGAASPDDLVGVVQYMRSVAGKTGKPSAVVPYLGPALAATAGDASFAAEHERLRIDHALLVTGDKDEAVSLKRAAMPDGWRDDASQLNSFAWWCFESGVALEEAEMLARRGAELAAPGNERAMILDTAAEICNARGNCDDAVELMRQAVAEAPDGEHYRKQLTRFEEIRASRAN